MLGACVEGEDVMKFGEHTPRTLHVRACARLIEAFPIAAERTPVRRRSALKTWLFVAHTPGASVPHREDSPMNMQLRIRG